MEGIKNNRQGLTLIELILSTAILGIIIIAFMPLFVMSAKNTSKSENTLNATYLGKDTMEFIYQLSQTPLISYDNLEDELVNKNGYTKLVDDAYGLENPDKKYIYIKITKDDTEDRKPVKVIVKIYSDKTMSHQEVQYESLYFWHKGVT